MSTTVHPTRAAERLRLARLSTTHRAPVTSPARPASPGRLRAVVPMARWSRDHR